MVRTLKELRYELNKLSNDNTPELSADISVILMHHLKINKTRLLLGDVSVSDAQYNSIMESITRLKGGEPVQYIVGFCEFMSLKFITKPGVLIPRADTEILVESVMPKISENSQVADLCCGSGCIGLSIAYYMKDTVITAVDISDEALSIAKENADNLGVSDRVNFLNMDILNNMPCTLFDCIVSNPPYIQSDVIEKLEPKVRDREPRIALDGGIDGLIFYRRIAKIAPLKNGGLLAFEIGYDQGRAVSEILEAYGYSDICVVQDIENRDRVVLAIKRFAK